MITGFITSQTEKGRNYVSLQLKEKHRRRAVEHAFLNRKSGHPRLALVASYEGESDEPKHKA
ncbi:MAG: hypothetical protein JXR97_13710 [Planctomycetes bacterium]|nr:hypothetical protein [Planctomycetota bacterium]